MNTPHILVFSNVHFCTFPEPTPSSATCSGMSTFCRSNRTPFCLASLNNLFPLTWRGNIRRRNRRHVLSRDTDILTHKIPRTNYTTGQVSRADRQYRNLRRLKHPAILQYITLHRVHRSILHLLERVMNLHVERLTTWAIITQANTMTWKPTKVCAKRS